MAADNAYSFISKLMGSDAYSDLTLVCEGETFKVHKAIVCSQSPVLAAAVSGHFEEAKTNTIEVNFDVATLKRMISFMYTGDYEVEESEDDTEALLTVRHVRMNEIADYYDLPRLVQLANLNADDMLTHAWSADAFVGAMREATAGEKGLQQIFAAAASQNMADIVPHPGFAQLDNVSPFTVKVMGILKQQIQDLSTELTALRSKAKTVRARSSKNEGLFSDIGRSRAIFNNLHRQ